MSKTSILELGTPYMLRHDGVLLNCNLIHPTFNYFLMTSDKMNIYIENKFNYGLVDWYKENTRNNLVIEKIDKLTTTKLNIPESVKLIKEIVNLTEKEFVKVRMSNLKWSGKGRDIYFRITPSDFDWSDLIWKVVYEYRNQIESVTICEEDHTFTVNKVYCLSDGTPIDKLSTEEYLMTSGKIYLSRDDFVNKTFKFNLWRSVK